MSSFILKRPILIISILIIFTVIFGNGISKIKTDTDVTKVLPDNMPAKAFYDRIGEIFPSKEVIIIGIDNTDKFTIEKLKRIDRLTKKLEAISLVDSVLSITNVKLFSATYESIDIHSISDNMPNDEIQLQKTIKTLYDQPLLTETILSEKGRYVAILIFVNANAREADVAKEVLALTQDANQNEGFILHVAGRPTSAHWSRVVMGRDMGILTTLAFLVIIIILIATFRSFRGFILPIIIVTASNIWTFGLMGYIGIKFTHGLEVLPILLLAIGVADGIHILKGYYERIRDSDNRYNIVKDTLNDQIRPVTLTSITTIVGFLALNSSGLATLMTLGLFTAFGIFVAWFFSLFFLPAVLLLIPLTKQSNNGIFKRFRSSQTHFVKIENYAEIYGQFLNRNNKSVLLVILLIVILSLYGASKVFVQFSTISNYQKDHPFRIANDFMNRNFHGNTNLTLVIDGHEENAIKNSLLLKKIDQLELWLKSQPHINAVQSIVGSIKQIHRILNGGSMSEYRIPEINELQYEKNLIAQYFLIYELNSRPAELANVITYDYSSTKLIVFVDTDKSNIVGQINARVDEYISKNFVDVNIQLTGMTVLLVAINDLVVTGQAWSIIISLSLVFFIASIMFRSVVMGMFCCVPLFFSLFLNFGFMGLTKIPLNVETMATSSVAIGVGIDFAIHYVHRFQKICFAINDYSRAVILSLKSSGVAIFLNMLTVATGFSVLMFSGFLGVKYLGLLIALTMLTSAFATITLLPVIFSTLQPSIFTSQE